MHDMSDEDRKAVFGEAILDELKAIREYLTDIPIIKEDVKDLQVRMTRVEDGMNVTKVVLREHESEIQSLKRKFA